MGKVVKIDGSFVFVDMDFVGEIKVKQFEVVNIIMEELFNVCFEGGIVI